MGLSARKRGSHALPPRLYAPADGVGVAPLPCLELECHSCVPKWSCPSAISPWDEADAFLRRREDDAMGEAMRSALNALLARTGSQSTHFCLVLASNRPVGPVR